jgi:hypothetical protein
MIRMLLLRSKWLRSTSDSRLSMLW